MQNHALRSDQHEHITLDYQNIQLKIIWENPEITELFQHCIIMIFVSSIVLRSLKCPIGVQALRLLFQTLARNKQHIFHENGAVKIDISR